MLGLWFGDGECASHERARERERERKSKQERVQKKNNKKKNKKTARERQSERAREQKSQRGREGESETGREERARQGERGREGELQRAPHPQPLNLKTPNHTTGRTRLHTCLQILDGMEQDSHPTPRGKPPHATAATNEAGVGMPIPRWPELHTSRGHHYKSRSRTWQTWKAGKQPANLGGGEGMLRRRTPWPPLTLTTWSKQLGPAPTQLGPDRTAHKRKDHITERHLVRDADSL